MYTAAHTTQHVQLTGSLLFHSHRMHTRVASTAMAMNRQNTHLFGVPLSDSFSAHSVTTAVTRSFNLLTKPSPRTPTTSSTSNRQSRACHSIQPRAKGRPHHPQHQCTSSGSQEDEQPASRTSGDAEIFTGAGGVTRREFFTTLGSAGAAAAAWAAVASSATAATGAATDRKVAGGGSKAVFGTVRQPVAGLPVMVHVLDSA